MASPMKNLLKKVNYRLTRLIGQYVPYRTQYRPIGTYATSKEFYQHNQHKGARYIDLYPSLTTRLQVPEALFKALSPYKIYDAADTAAATLTVQTNYHLVKVPHGRIYSDNVTHVAVISEDNKLIHDVSFQFSLKQTCTPAENAVFNQKYFHQPIQYKGTVFSALIGGGPINNYGHWLIDVLPRIYLLKESGLFDSVDWFLVPNYQYDYQKESLKLLGIDESKVINGQQVHHLQADAIITTTAPRGERSFLIPDWITHLHRKYLLTDETIDNKTYPELVYISRKDSKLRKVVNEDQVIDVLSGYGFETIVSSELSFQEKINLFAKAKVIVSASSAGLGSLFYGNAAGEVLEIFSQGFVHTHYYNMAQSIGMGYHYLICKHPAPATTGKQGERENITVDIDELQKALHQMLVLQEQAA
jgi:hypothetical protein